MVNAALVFIGGGIGAVGRFWLDGLVQRRIGATLPVGTFTVNAIGCFLIGILMTTLEDRFLMSPALRVFLTIGILGGFTTFSTFSFETVAMIRQAEYLYACGNALLTLTTCLAATSLGMTAGKLF